MKKECLLLKHNISEHTMPDDQSVLSIIDNVTKFEIQANKMCHFRCVYCSNNDGEKSESVPLDKVFELMDTFSNLTHVIITGGEPLLIPEYTLAIAEHAKARNKSITTQVNTTGSILNDTLLASCKKVIDIMHISLNTLQPDIFEAYRRAPAKNIEIINNNLKKLADAGFYVIAENCVSKFNISEMLDIYKKCEELGVNRYLIQHLMLVGRANHEMLYDFNIYKNNLLDIFEYHKKQVINGSHMELFLACFYSQKFKDIRDQIINQQIPQTKTNICECGEAAIWISAEGYLMPCNTGFELNDYKDCSIYEKSIEEILAQKQMYNAIRSTISDCKAKGACRLYNTNSSEAFYD